VGWRQFVMNLESLDPDRVDAAFSALGALSVTMTDAGDDPVLEPGPGETPLWSQTLITALFEADTDLDAVADGLRASLDLDELPDFHFEDLDDRPWECEWLKDFRPMRFGERLWVIPGDDPAPEAEGIVVRLDPGLAFGTGTHPTTALCLEWLESTGVDGRTVFDFGCGSGILGIAAL
jgi:ribosomal protein L11 methyltransferase